MPDVAIVNTTVTPAPTDYTVPGTQELLVKAVRASIDGTGTASAWLPALQLLDPAGHVMWTAVNPSDSVAAGASADVSWFPGVKPSAGATGATAYLNGVFAAQTIPSGGAGAHVRWNHFQTNNTSVFATDVNAVSFPGPFHNTAGDSFLYLLGLGSYVAGGAAQLAAGVYAQSALLFNDPHQWLLDANAGEFTTEENLPTNTDVFGNAGGQNPSSRKLFYVDSTTLPGVASLIVTQTSGAAKGLVQVNMGIVYGDGGTGDLALIY